MIRGLYTSATGMLAAETQSEIIGDNVANVKTPGYKEENGSALSFPDMLIERMGGDGNPAGVPIGALNTGVGVDRTVLSGVQGALDKTGVNTDLALTTPGYFAVQTPGGERYTRNGHFHLDSNGMLVTSDGYELLGNNGPIGPLGPDFSVDTAGIVRNNGQQVAQLRIVQIPANAEQREGQSLYNSAQPVQTEPNPQILQGSIEASNVDLAGQMVQMMTVMKAYEANQKVIQTQDDLLNKAVNDVGKV